jgi:Uma2 family endonuclease
MAPAVQVAGNRRRYTYADYKKWDDDVRREIIGGQVYLMSAPSGEHQGISAALSAKFFNYLVGKSCRVFAAPYDVRLFAPLDAEDDDESDHDIVQPDLAVICDRRKRHHDGCHGAPDLIVEILSESNRSHDMLLKFNKYLEAGVREYWIVDRFNRILQIHTLLETPSGRRYVTSIHDAADTVKAGIFEDLAINMADVFAAGEEG